MHPIKKNSGYPTGKGTIKLDMDKCAWVCLLNYFNHKNYSKHRGADH